MTETCLRLNMLLCQTGSALQILQVVVFLRVKCSNTLDALKCNRTTAAAAVTLCFVNLLIPVTHAKLSHIGWKREGSLLRDFSSTE